MIPSRIFVGDRANLILSLRNLSLQYLPSGNVDIELSPERFPVSEEIDFHRITAEIRPGDIRLVIELSAFAPGILEIPSFEFAGLIFSDITIEVSSILDIDGLGPVLSGPAGTLAVPGTSFLVYGTLSAILLLLILILWIGFKGRKLLEKNLALWKRKRLISAIKRIEKRLRKSLAKNASAGEVLEKLSIEFRSFLSSWTGENCCAMTALELSLITPNGEFLKNFFTKCDKLRFSGEKINGDEAKLLLDDLKMFLKKTEADLRKKPQEEGAEA